MAAESVIFGRDILIQLPLPEGLRGHKQPAYFAVQTAMLIALMLTAELRGCWRWTYRRRAVGRRLASAKTP